MCSGDMSNIPWVGHQRESRDRPSGSLNHGPEPITMVELRQQLQELMEFAQDIQQTNAEIKTTIEERENCECHKSLEDRLRVAESKLRTLDKQSCTNDQKLEQLNNAVSNLVSKIDETVIAIEGNKSICENQNEQTCTTFTNILPDQGHRIRKDSKRRRLHTLTNLSFHKEMECDKTEGSDEITKRLLGLSFGQNNVPRQTHVAEGSSRVSNSVTTSTCNSDELSVNNNILSNGSKSGGFVYHVRSGHEEVTSVMQEDRNGMSTFTKQMTNEHLAMSPISKEQTEHGRSWNGSRNRQEMTSTYDNKQNSSFVQNPHSGQNANDSLPYVPNIPVSVNVISRSTENVPNANELQDEPSFRASHSRTATTGDLNSRSKTDELRYETNVPNIIARKTSQSQNPALKGNCNDNISGSRAARTSYNYKERTDEHRTDITRVHGYRARKTNAKDDNRQIFHNEMDSSPPRDRSEQRVSFQDIDEQNIVRDNIKQSRRRRTRSGNDDVPKKDAFFKPSTPDRGRKIDTATAKSMLDTWIKKANTERIKGSTDLLPHGKGPNTVLCLDVSESMRGKGFQELKAVAREIISGVQTVACGVSIEENIAISTFGDTTAVMTHLTNDYSSLLSLLDSLTAGGSAPIYAGLLMALSGCVGNGHSTSIQGRTIHAKIVLISNGLAGLDVDETESEELKLFLMPVLLDLEQRGHRVFCVPVGEANMELLSWICSTTKGKIIPQGKVRRLIKSSQNIFLAAQMTNDCTADDMDRQTMTSVIRAMHDTVPLQDEDTDDIIDEIEFMKSNKGKAQEYEQLEGIYKETNPEMPPLGSRVRRGPNWAYGNQDSEGVGTVIGHTSGGFLWVEWDNGEKNRYPLVANAFSVMVVEEPRFIFDDLVAVGCVVKRSKELRSRNPNGIPDGLGVVLRVEEDGHVLVRWSNKSVLQHNFGFDGIFELELCTENETSQVFDRQPATRDPAPESNRNALDSNLSSNATNNRRSSISVSDTYRVKAPSDDVITEMNRRNAEESTAIPVTKLSHSSTSSRASSREQPVVNRTQTSSSDEVLWQFCGEDQVWHTYHDELQKTIESAYKRNPKGTKVIQLHNAGYRLTFSALTKYDTSTKKEYKIRRKVKKIT